VFHGFEAVFIAFDLVLLNQPVVMKNSIFLLRYVRLKVENLDASKRTEK
jgi:hypothetical protein